MGRTPLILIASPLHAHHEEQHSGDAEESSNIVNLSEDVAARQAFGVHTWGWMVEDGREYKANKSPQCTKESAIPLINRQ